MSCSAAAAGGIAAFHNQDKSGTSSLPPWSVVGMSHVFAGVSFGAEAFISIPNIIFLMKYCGALLSLYNIHNPQYYHSSTHS